MNFLIRSVKEKDAEQLKQLAEAFQLCNLPRDTSALKKKIQLSVNSFHGELAFKERGFLFVLEEKRTGRLIGSCQILPCAEVKKHPYFELGKNSLRLFRDSRNRVQLGGLILLKEFRGHPEKLGRQIGAVRFLYMLKDPAIWPDIVEVSLTAPLQNDNTASSFWNETGGKFLSGDYMENSALYQGDLPRFLSQIPKEMRVNLSALSPSALQALKTVHPDTRSLYHGLLKIGFKETSHRHFLDGGLSLEAIRGDIPFISRGRRGVWNVPESVKHTGATASGLRRRLKSVWNMSETAEHTEGVASRLRRGVWNVSEPVKHTKEKNPVLLKSGRPEKPSPWLWGQQIGGEFKGGSVSGEMKENEVFLMENIPEDMNTSHPLFLTPLNISEP